MNVESQNINVEYSAGYGFYDLSDIKSMQYDFIYYVDLHNIKAVEKFPNNVYHSFSAGYFINKKNLAGLKFSYLTTGGRNHVADYSGEYKLDMILNGYLGGFKYQYVIYESNGIGIGLQSDIGIIFTNLNLNEKLTVFDEEITSTSDDLSNTSLYIEPSINLNYNLFKGINIHLNGAYNVDFKNKLFLEDEKTDIYTNWSGFRISFGINYNISLKKSLIRE